MSDLRGLVVTPDGMIEEKMFPPTGQGFLDALRSVINCDTVEAVRLAPDGLDATMYADEHGDQVQLPMSNEYATVIVYGFNASVRQMYYGTAVFLGGPDGKGDDTSLSDKADIYLRYLMFEIKRGKLGIHRIPGGQF